MNGEVESLEAAVGRAARAYREYAGITLDQLATQMREHGLKWSTARVIEFEKGKLRLTLPMLLALARSLSFALNQPIALGDLLPEGSKWVKITDEWITTRDSLREVLGAVPVNLVQLVSVEESDPAAEISVLTPSDWIVATLAEERAAKRLGVRPRQVALWSHMLWGRHLDEEAALRSDADASPQARGHMTRELARIIGERIEAQGEVDTEFVPRREGGATDGDR